MLPCVSVSLQYYIKKYQCLYLHFLVSYVFRGFRCGRRGRDRIIVGFTTSYAISAYHHCCELECCSNERNSVQYYAIKFYLVSSTNKTFLHDISALCVNVELNTIYNETLLSVLDFISIPSLGMVR